MIGRETVRWPSTSITPWLATHCYHNRGPVRRRKSSNRGIMYAIKNKNDEAIADFSEAIRLDRNDASSFSNRGATYAAKEEYHRSLADYNEAIRLDPTMVS